MTMTDTRVPAPPLVYIKGEEMSAYTMQLILKKNRDATADAVLGNAVAAGKTVRAIFKEPTVTPSFEQAEKLGLKAPLRSPNGVMRRGWNGVAISRDTIHVEGVELGFRNQVVFDRHAVGGEYEASFDVVGPGKVETIFTALDGSTKLIGARTLADQSNAVVTYHNPLDNVAALGHIFFQRCLQHDATPYVVTKRTVFKWQDNFWLILRAVFDAHFRPQFAAKGLLQNTSGELGHLLSDSAAMQAIRWRGGGFGMVAHNYDGDVLSDELSELHRSPAFMSSVLVGATEAGLPIKQFEASHGTGSDQWASHLAGMETSMNPLGMAEALLAAVEFSAEVDAARPGGHARLLEWVAAVRGALHAALRDHGTRDVAGPHGLTTEAFVEAVATSVATGLRT